MNATKGGLATAGLQALHQSLAVLVAAGDLPNPISDCTLVNAASAPLASAWWPWGRAAPGRLGRTHPHGESPEDQRASMGMASRRAMRLPMGGCVLKRLKMPPPLRGFTIIMWAVAGSACRMGTCSL